MTLIKLRKKGELKIQPKDIIIFDKEIRCKEKEYNNRIILGIYLGSLGKDYSLITPLLFDDYYYDRENMYKSFSGAKYYRSKEKTRILNLIKKRTIMVSNNSFKKCSIENSAEEINKKNTSITLETERAKERFKGLLIEAKLFLDDNLKVKNSYNSSSKHVSKKEDCFV